MQNKYRMSNFLVHAIDNLHCATGGNKLGQVYIFFYTFLDIYIHIHIHTHTYYLSYTDTLFRTQAINTHSLSLTHTISHFLAVFSDTHTLSYTQTLSLSLSLSVSNIHTYAVSVYIMKSGKTNKKYNSEIPANCNRLCFSV